MGAATWAKEGVCKGDGKGEGKELEEKPEGKGEASKMGAALADLEGKGGLAGKGVRSKTGSSTMGGGLEGALQRGRRFSSLSLPKRAASRAGRIRISRAWTWGGAACHQALSLIRAADGDEKSHIGLLTRLRHQKRNQRLSAGGWGPRTSCAAELLLNPDVPPRVGSPSWLRRPPLFENHRGGEGRPVGGGEATGGPRGPSWTFFTPRGHCATVATTPLSSISPDLEPASTPR